MKDHKSLTSSTKIIDIKTWYFFQLFDIHKYLQNPNQFTSLYDTYAAVKQCGYNYQTILILILLSNDTDTDTAVKRYWYDTDTVSNDTDTAVEWYWYDTETYFLENLTTLIYIYVCIYIYIYIYIH